MTEDAFEAAIELGRYFLAHSLALLNAAGTRPTAGRPARRCRVAAAERSSADVPPPGDDSPRPGDGSAAEAGDGGVSFPSPASPGDGTAPRTTDGHAADTRAAEADAWTL